MRADASLRPPKPPRGLILSTGEDVPRGQSLRARMLVVEVAPNEVGWTLLTRCQADAAAGVYSQALAGYLRWLAGRYRSAQRGLRERVRQLRDLAAAGGQHKRTPVISAELYAGLESFADYAADVAAISEGRRFKLLAGWWKVLVEAAAAQDAIQSGGDPVLRFAELLTAAVASGRAHVAGLTGDPPHQRAGWGWRQSGGGWEPRGDRVGWVEGPDLYLEPEAAYGVAQRMAHDGNEPLAVGSKTLHKRLHEQGLLRTVDAQRRHLTVRKGVEGRIRQVLHVRAALLGGNILVEPPAPE
jgi:hypothetical protein